MKKRFLSLLLAAIMVLSVLPFGASAAGFSDVKSDAYYYDAVQWAVKKNITAGTSATAFSPNATCTRAQVVTFLWRANGEPKPKSSKNPFTDVKSGAYYYNAVLWAVERGITAGTSATKFSPSDKCTRGQVVTFLWRNKNQPKARGANSFLDVNPSHYFYQPVCWAVGRGVTSGTGLAAFSPNTACTRGQIVTFLHRDLTKSDEYMNTFTDLQLYTSYLDGRMTSAYANLVRDREKTYGKAAFVDGQWMSGVACVRLIDLDNNGTLELLLWENTISKNFPNAATIEIWTWTGSNAKRLYGSYPLTGGDPSGQALALIKMDKQYQLVLGENGGVTDVEFYGIKDGALVRRHTMTDWDGNTYVTRFDGKKVSGSYFESLYDQMVFLCNAWEKSADAQNILTETAATRTVLGL